MNHAIQEFAQERGIPFLTHFTRVENLPSIMEHGVVPVADAVGLGIAAQTNDLLRLDHQRGASCVSIGFPNHRMFYRYRMDDETAHWAVLGIHPSVLWQKPCAFCQRNAADALVTAIPIANRMTPDAFAGIYAEIDGHRTREEQKLKPYDPTHDQAEVLVFSTIEPPLIGAVAFNSPAAKAQYENLFPGRQVLRFGKNRGLFGTRSYSREY